jgi:hypothetical protein
MVPPAAKRERMVTIMTAVAAVEAAVALAAVHSAAVRLAEAAGGDD